MLIATILVRLLAFIVSGQPAQCMISADLKRASNILYHTHGVALVKEDRNFHLKAFESFTKLDLTQYKFSEKRLNNYHVKSWKSRGAEKISIYEVQNSVYVDTAVMICIDSSDKQIKYPVHTTFNYRSYFLFRAGKPDLHFTINVKGDAMAFDVGKHTIGILYKDVAMGEELPDTKVLRKLLH
jgi:hypothetical protein